MSHKRPRLNEANVNFEDLGFYKEYYVNGKFIGFAKCEKDREVFGYYGKKDEVLAADIVLQNKKRIKAGTAVVTQLFPLCGKLSDNDRPNAVKNGGTQ